MLFGLGEANAAFHLLKEMNPFFPRFLRILAMRAIFFLQVW
jgi:hypothetical protein